MIKLFRFEYSCYSRKVQMLLDLMSEISKIIDPWMARLEQWHPSI